MGSEIIFLVPYVAGFAAVATVIGTFIVWLIWAGARHWGPRPVREGSTVFPTRFVASVLLCLTLPVGCLRACQPVPQPESLRTVAAFEVPIRTAADRTDLLAILNREAAAEGLEVHAESQEALEQRNQTMPDDRTTTSIEVRRGDAWQGNEAHISDTGRDGHTWISFSRGKVPALARRFRDRVMRKIVDRWPDTLSVPVADTGALPHRTDLVLGDQGYEIDPAKLAGYTCDPSLGPEAAPPSSCQ